MLGQLRERPEAIPDPTPPRGPAPLTVGIATYEDFDGAWFTIQSLVLHHREALAGAEILLLDNHPEGPAAPELKRFETSVPGYRYLPVTTVRSTAVRDLLFRHAQGEVVLVLDSHVLLDPGALRAVRDYFAERPGCRDLVQGPMLGEDGSTVVGTHWEPAWRGGMFGTWAVDERGTDPGAGAFDIPLQGLGLFACRRDAWPGLHPKFRGFGGEEGYVHEKVRRGGGRTVCLPAVRWSHRSTRPLGIPYVNTWQDRIRNYELGWRELGWDLTEARAYYRAELAQAHPGLVEEILRQVDTELAHPAARFDGVLRPVDPVRPAAPLSSVAWGGVPVTGIEAVPGDSAEASRALTHRLCLDFARLHGWRSVLIVDEDFELPPRADDAAPGPIELFTTEDGSDRPAAVGYDARAIAELPAQLPQYPADAADWLEAHGPLHQWLRDLGARRVPVAAVAAEAAEAAEADAAEGAATAAAVAVSGAPERAAAIPAQRRPRRAADLEVHEVSDGLVVYRAADDSMHHLNPLASAVFELSDGEGGADLAEELAEIFGLAEDQAREVVRIALADLRDRALLC